MAPRKSQLSAYGGSKLGVLCEDRTRMWRDDFKCLLDCKIVYGKAVRPLLNRKACIGMNIIKYTDNDELNKPENKYAQVYSPDCTALKTRDTWPAHKRKLDN